MISGHCRSVNRGESAWFRRPRRSISDVRVDAISNSSNASSYDELGGSSTADRHSCNLDDDTDDHNGCSEEDALASTQVIAKCENEAGAEETTYRIDRNDESFICTIALDFREIAGEGFRGNDACAGIIDQWRSSRSRHGLPTRHNTLIVTKQ